MTARLSFDRPDIPLMVGGSARPGVGRMGRPARGRRSAGIPRAGHRRVGVLET